MPKPDNSPPSTPDLDEDPAINVVETNENLEGGFLPEESDGFEGTTVSQEDSRPENFVIQLPTPDCPHFRIVPASGFISTVDSGISVAAASKDPDDKSEICVECGSNSISKKYQENFSVFVCQECIDSKAEVYGLVSKTTAIDEYCVGEADLEGLGCIRRRNPRKDNWNEMKLLLRAQVIQRSLTRHGSPEGIEQARRKRADEAARRKRQREGKESVLRRPETAAARTPETALADDGRGGLAGAGAGAGGRRRRAAAEAMVARVVVPRHVHVWGPEWQEPADGAGGDTWRRKCEGGGLVTRFEKL
jgi:DNA repair protein